jgi:hypothetical protein
MLREILSSIDVRLNELEDHVDLLIVQDDLTRNPEESSPDDRRDG